MVIFGNYLRAGHGSGPVWLRGPKLHQKFRSLTGPPMVVLRPNPKLMITLTRICASLGSLKASFSARRMLQFKKKEAKIGQSCNKQQQQQTTNNKRPFFLPKINKVFLRPVLQNLKGRSVLDKFFFENDPFDVPNQMPLSKKFYLFRKLVKIAK